MFTNLNKEQSWPAKALLSTLKRHFLKEELLCKVKFIYIHKKEDSNKNGRLFTWINLHNINLVISLIYDSMQNCITRLTNTVNVYLFIYIYINFDLTFIQYYHWLSVLLQNQQLVIFLYVKHWNDTFAE